MFRLPEANALINRLGFNNEGLGAFLANVQRAYSFRKAGGIVGLNIGKNAATPIEQAAQDYLTALAGVYPHADYITVNISSPNTKNLRALQGDAELAALLGQLERKARLAAEHGRQVPMFVKIAPDLDEAQVETIATTLKAQGIDGVDCHQHHARARGGQGLGACRGDRRPVWRARLEASNRVIRQLRARGRGLPIIGVGGVLSGADAAAKRAAGADLVQVYTGLIYRGPALVPECAKRWRNSPFGRAFFRLIPRGRRGLVVRPCPCLPAAFSSSLPCCRWPSATPPRRARSSRRPSLRR